VTPLGKLKVAGPSVMENRAPDGTAGRLLWDPNKEPLKMSGNGRYLFTTVAGDSNLLPVPGNEFDTVLVRKDLRTGTWEPVTDPSGTHAADELFSVSDDGQKVAYVAGDESNPRLFLADLAKGTRQDLTAKFPVERADQLLPLTLSGDGTTLIAGKVNESSTSETEALYRWVDGQPGPAVKISACPLTTCTGWHPGVYLFGHGGGSVSDDGRKVAFTATHREPGVCGSTLTGTYLWDASTGKTMRYSPTPTKQAGWNCVDATTYESATISGDGKILAYVSMDWAYRGGLSMGPLGALQPVGPIDGGGRALVGVQLSDDGRIAVYTGETADYSMPDGERRAAAQVWACDRLTSFCVLLSDVPGTGEESYFSLGGEPQISDDGRLAAFRTHGEVVGVKDADGEFPPVVVSRGLTF
jgi:Tol biopolymer transport system component